MFRKVLVPVDFSEKNYPAVKAALSIAEQTNGSVTLLHVIEKVDYLSAAELKTFYARLEKNAERKMREFFLRFAKKRKVEMDEQIIYGKPAREVVKFAAEGAFDLIVLSSHKITPQNLDPGAGTVSYRIAILSQCPVLLVK